MRVQKSVYYMTDRELRIYKRLLSVSQSQRFSADDGRSVYRQDRIYEQGGILLCGSSETGWEMSDRGFACLRMAEP